jgi:hypothetical protein
MTKSRIRIARPEGSDLSNSPRRTTLTRLAKIAKACGAIVLFGLSSEKSRADVGAYVGNNPATGVIWDGSGRPKR